MKLLSHVVFHVLANDVGNVVRKFVKMICKMLQVNYSIVNTVMQY